MNPMPLNPTPKQPTPEAAPQAAGTIAGQAAAGPIAVPSGEKGPAQRVRKSRSLVLCPYCGEPTQPAARCGSCRGLMDPLSLQASQNAMGPWFIHDSANPYRPGCSYETVVSMAKRGKIDAHTVLRGPTTKQFWCAADATPGVSHLFGVCHQCRADVQPTDGMCDDCGADFTVETDRQHLGLNPVEPLPGQAGSNESGVVSTAVGPGGKRAAVGGAESGSAIAADDLNAAIGVLTRRLRTQTRLVNGLATSVIALLVMLVGLGAWLAADRAAGIGGGVGFMRSSRPDGPAAAPAVAPVPDATTGATAHDQQLDQPRNEAAPAKAAPTPEPAVNTRSTPPAVMSPEPAPPTPVDPAEKQVEDLIAKDTVESLTKALELIPKGDDPGAAAASGRRRAVEMRLEQLKLKGLP